VHAVRDHDRLVHDPPTVADLLDLPIKPQVRVLAFHRPRPERLHPLIEQLTDSRDLGLRDAQPERLHQLVNRLVETPHTYACCTTLNSARSPRFPGSSSECGK
jgi:hypothetical protein